jgi:predicted metal-dependent hydrolase
VKPAAIDPFPDEIQIIRGRRRSVELWLENGRLVARAPRRMRRADLDPVLASLRRQLWRQLSRRSVFDDEALEARADRVARRLLGDLGLPPFTVRFSSRQQKRWGSCNVEEGRGRLWITHRLIGHPTWVLDHVLLHELIHLVLPNHGPEFQRLLARDPRHDRALGYLEALEHVEQIGSTTPLLEARSTRVRALPENPSRGADDLPLFAGAHGPLESA